MVSFFSLKFKIEMDIVFSLKVRLIDVLHSGESYNVAEPEEPKLLLRSRSLNYVFKSVNI